MSLARRFSPVVNQEYDRRRMCQHPSEGKTLKYDGNFCDQRRFAR